MEKVEVLDQNFTMLNATLWCPDFVGQFSSTKMVRLKRTPVLSSFILFYPSFAPAQGGQQLVPRELYEGSSHSKGAKDAQTASCGTKTKVLCQDHRTHDTTAKKLY